MGEGFLTEAGSKGISKKPTLACLMILQPPENGSRELPAQAADSLADWKPSSSLRSLLLQSWEELCLVNSNSFFSFVNFLGLYASLTSCVLSLIPPSLQERTFQFGGDSYTIAVTREIVDVYCLQFWKLENPKSRYNGFSICSGITVRFRETFSP